MPVIQIIIQIIAFSLALWLGLYLIARNLANPRLRYAGLGLMIYAFSLATDLLSQVAGSELAFIFLRLHWATLFLPALFWLGTVIYLLPEELPIRRTLARVWEFGLLPVAVPVYALTAAANLIIDFSKGIPQAGPAYFLFAAAVLLPMLGALFLVWQTFRASRPKVQLGLALAATIFAALGAGLLVYPLNWLSRSGLLVGISLDFISLGVAIAWLDAFDEGETLLPDFVRSFSAAFFFALLFGGLVVLTMVLSRGATFGMLVLLLAVITVALASQTFADALQTTLDRLSFAPFPRLRQARAELRTTASVLPRIDSSLDPTRLDEAEFTRLTRRALSYLGNLPRLAASPLTRLPIIYTRLAQRGAADNTLERAAELKLLLTESIEQLKPPGPETFGITDEWRYYNALYFPYVVGLKPFSRRADYAGLDSTARQALDWFQTYVPERTLYNWQTAAAALIARNLREQQVCPKFSSAA